MVVSGPFRLHTGSLANFLQEKYDRLYTGCLAFRVFNKRERQKINIHDGCHLTFSLCGTRVLIQIVGKKGKIIKSCHILT